MGLDYPDIFLIGEQKCGTTSLNKLLIDHPRICRKGVKEKHFFSDSGNDTEWLSKTDAFNSEFSKCKKNELTIDATPSYVSLDYVPDRIKRSYTADNLRAKKFILVLREPAARHYSEYQRLVPGCLVLLDDAARMAYASSEMVETAENKCRAILKKHSKGDQKFNLSQIQVSNVMTFNEWSNSFFGLKQLARGEYHAQITNWLQYISRSQLMILNFEELVTDTTATMLRLSRFLNIDGTAFYNKHRTIVLPAPAARNHYVAYDLAKLDCETLTALERYFLIVNQGLLHVINNHTSRPDSEPIFAPFRSSAHKCTWTNITFELKGLLGSERRDHKHFSTNHTHVGRDWNLTETGWL